MFDINVSCKKTVVNIWDMPSLWLRNFVLDHRHDWICIVVFERRRSGIFTVRRYALHGICYSDSVCLSVCPSVCLSVTLVDHMVRPTIMISSPYGSPIILVSRDVTIIAKFEGGHPERGCWMRVGWVRIGDFQPISLRNYLRNGARYDKGYY